MMELFFVQPLKTTAVPLTVIRSRALGGGVLVPVAALIVSLGSSAICYSQTGLTLGVFLGALVLATLFAPPLILTENAWRSCLSVLVAIVLGPTIVWLSVANNTHLVTFHQVLQCAMVLAAWVSVVSGTALLLHEFRLVPALAATVTVVVSSLWLTWPIWLSPMLAGHQRAVGWLCWAHPIMAINSVVRQLGLWGSPMGGSDLAYRYLTILNQDVAYPHSQSIWPCVLIHGLIGMTLLSVSFLLGTLRCRRHSTR
jgi:hypothetical protein